MPFGHDMPAEDSPLLEDRRAADQTVYGIVPLRELDREERPQERLERLGPTALADRELLAMILRSGSAKLDVLALSDHLLKEAGSLSGMLRWTTEDFQALPGIGKVKALQLTTLMELTKRIARSERSKAPILDSPEKIFHHLYPDTQGLTVEKFWVLCLDRKNKLIKMEEITKGTVDASLAHPREVFQAAIRRGASAVIAVHNHPSGDSTPSPADIEMTEEVCDAGKKPGISLLDHLINSRNGHSSFKSLGLL